MLTQGHGGAQWPSRFLAANGPRIVSLIGSSHLKDLAKTLQRLVIIGLEPPEEVFALREKLAARVGALCTEARAGRGGQRGRRVSRSRRKTSMMICSSSLSSIRSSLRRVAAARRLTVV